MMDPTPQHHHHHNNHEGHDQSPQVSARSSGSPSHPANINSPGRKQVQFKNNPKASSLLQTFGNIKVGDPFINTNAVRVSRALCY